MYMHIPQKPPKRALFARQKTVSREKSRPFRRNPDIVRSETICTQRRQPVLFLDIGPNTKPSQREPRKAANSVGDCTLAEATHKIVPRERERYRAKQRKPLSPSLSSERAGRRGSPYRRIKRSRLSLSLSLSLSLFPLCVPISPQPAPPGCRLWALFVHSLRLSAPHDENC